SAQSATLVDQVVDRTITLASIPGPTGEEAARAELITLWWRGDGFDEVHDDAAGNVWARARAGVGPAVLLAAHLDTGLGGDGADEIVRDGDTLRGPGVGDNAVGVAGIGAAAAAIASEGPPVWLCATVGEEGLGNLAGITAALESPPAELGAVLAVEGN